MRISYIHTLLSVFILSGMSAGCQQKGGDKAGFNAPEFAETDTVTWQPLHNDLLVGNVNDMAVDDSVIYILAPVQGTWLHAYSRHDGTHLGDYLTQGNGPGEAVNATSLRIDNANGTASVFDAMTGMVHTYSINGQNGGVTYKGSETVNGLLNVVRRCLMADSTTYILEGAHGENPMARNIALAHPGEVRAIYSDVPLDSTKSLALLQNAHWQISPDGHRLVTSSLLGGVLETFDITNEKITPLATALYFDPGFSITSPKDRIDPENLVFGFSSVAATEKLVAGSFSGTKSANDFHKIGIWDWNLQPVRLLLTNSDVIAMAMPDDDSGMIYAVTLTGGTDFALQSLKI